MSDLALKQARTKPAKKSILLRDLKKRKYIYLMLLPVLIYYFVFAYLPMYGIVISFQEFSISKGVFGSDWVGLKHFKSFFSGIYFPRATRNTLVLNLLGLAFGFPAPIIFALLLNEIKSGVYKRTFQTLSYLPYFISLVVVCGLIRDFTSTGGLINTLAVKYFGYKGVSMLNMPSLYRPIYIISDIWQGLGWNSIIYLSAISGINPEYYEAAVLDGANRWQQVIHVTIPGIASTVIMLFILAMGGLMGISLEKPLLLYNQATYPVSDVISTYIYRQGLIVMEISYAAAVGLFNSIVNFIILIIANKIVGKVSGSSLF